MKSRTRVVRRSVSKNVSTAVQTNRLFSVRLHVYFFTRVSSNVILDTVQAIHTLAKSLNPLQ